MRVDIPAVVSVHSHIVSVDILSISVVLHVEHVDTTGMLSVVISVPTVVEFGSISTTLLGSSDAGILSMLVSDNRPAALRSL